MTELKNFIDKYNHLKIDEYLIEAKKIKHSDSRLQYWEKLLEQYNEDKNHLLYLNVLNGMNLQFEPELRFKKGGLLAQDLSGICLKQIELLRTSTKLNTSNRNTQKKISYVWQGNTNELPELYNLMINKYNLIAPETSEEQFKAVFTGQPIESIIPIKWHQDNASELLYFIDKLQQKNNIEHNPKRADHQKLKACFVKPDGKQFNENLKSLKQQFDFLSSDKQKAIDELVNNF